MRCFPFEPCPLSVALPPLNLSPRPAPSHARVPSQDREAVFAAWKVLLETDDTTGQALYGTDYMSHLRLAAEHNNLAGDRK